MRRRAKRLVKKENHRKENQSGTQYGKAHLRMGWTIPFFTEDVLSPFALGQMLCAEHR